MKLDIVTVFKKKSLESSREVNLNARLRHGYCAHAQVVGQVSRVEVYWNDYLPEGTPWLSRWMDLEDLRKTPKPVNLSDPDELRRIARKSRFKRSTMQNLRDAVAKAAGAVLPQSSADEDGVWPRLMSLRAGAPQPRC